MPGLDLGHGSNSIGFEEENEQSSVQISGADLGASLPITFAPVQRCHQD